MKRLPHKKGMEDPESAEGMDAQNREKVRAAACFENLAAGEYVLKETTPPNGSARQISRYKANFAFFKGSPFRFSFVKLTTPLFFSFLT